MNARDDRESLEHRVEEFRQLMAERRTLVEPGPYFVDRVIARLPRGEDLMLAWAARRVLPVTLGLAAILSVFVLVSNGSARQPAPAISSSSQHGSDPLDWLLENGQGVR
jgi:hypothetical protein